MTIPNEDRSKIALHAVRDRLEEEGHQVIPLWDISEHDGYSTRRVNAYSVPTKNGGTVLILERWRDGNETEWSWNYYIQASNKNDIQHETRAVLAACGLGETES